MSFWANRTTVVDAENNVAEVSRYGQTIVGERHDDISIRFEYNNSTSDVSTSVTGTGTSSNASSMAIVSTGATAGTSVIQSKRNIAYRPAHDVFAYFTSVYPSANRDANTYQRHGIFDAQDGFFFGYSGTTFGVTWRKGGSDTFIPQTSWNGDKCNGSGASRFNLDPTKLNQYKIEYAWLGIAPIAFRVYTGQSFGWTTAHTLDFTNTQTTPSILSPSLPMRMEVGRTSGSGAVTLNMGSCSAGTTMGTHSHAGHRVFSGELTKTLTAGVETYIGTFRNDPTFQGKTNKVESEAVYVGIATDGTKSVSIIMRRNATITGSPSWTQVDATNSITSYDIAGGFSGGVIAMSLPMAKVDTLALDLGAGHIHLELLPGETMTLTGLSAAASDVDISFRWEEYFS